jgi:hypothetical protein
MASHTRRAEAPGVMTSLRRSGVMEAYIQERTVHFMASQSPASWGTASRLTRSARAYLPQGVEEEATPLTVLRRVAIEHDGHQSTEVLDRDGLSVERGGEGLHVGDDERALGLADAFGLCVSRGLLSLLPGGAFGIGLSHDEQVVTAARVDSGSKVAGATNRIL